MRKSKKTIIYMLVALFVAVSVAFVGAGNIYAKSYCEDVQDAEWHYFTKTDGQVSNAVIDTSNYVSCDLPSDSKVSKYKYTEKLTWAYTSWNDHDYLYDYIIGSDSEIIYCYENVLSESSDKALNLNGGSAVGSSSYFFVFSKTKFSLRGTGGQDLSESSQTISSSDVRDSEIWNRDSFYMFCFSCDRYSPNMCFNSYKAKVFLDVSDALNYLSTGDTSGMAWQGSTPKQTYSSDLAFTSFDMSVHDSNSFDDYYLEFLYKCPEGWLGKNPKLVINQTWDYNIYYFDNKGTSSPLTVNGSNTCALSVSGDRNSIKIPLGQLDCLKEFVSNNLLGASSEMKRRVLGNTFSSPGIAYKDFVLKAGASCNVDKSFLSLSCVVYVDGVAGHEYVGSVDLITGDNSMATYTPDPSGNYTFNDDYKKGGHYYTNVGKDAAGNTTYNYYYYTTDNSKHEVTSQDSHDNTYTTTEAPASGGGGSASGDNSNNNVNNPTFNNNNNITIEGDTINNDVNNIVGNNTSSETNKNFIEKFLGFFQLLENNSFLGVWGKVFGWLPPGISSVITTALGIGACVGLFKFFRR